MDPKPYFSIVIPTLNEEEYLPYLLTDLTRQIHQDFEVIVVDGQSTDQTTPKALAFKHRLPSLKVLKSRQNNVSLQRNQGGKEARGKYILFVDADSRFPPYFLSGMAYRLASDPSDIFTCWCDTSGHTNTNKTIASIMNITIETAHLLDSPGALGALIGCKAETFIKTKGFNEKLYFGEDAEFVKRAYKSGLHFKIYRDPKYIYSLRRFKKTGTLRSFQKYALLHLKLLIGVNINQKREYPMGGKYTLTVDKPTQNLIDKIISTLEAGKTVPTIVKKIKALVALTEEE